MRLLRSMWQQVSRTPACPGEPRLDGQLALVTGGNSGIGYETCRGLALRGAGVIMAARNVGKAQEAAKRIGAETEIPLHFVALDLADLESVVAGTEEISRRWPDSGLDLVVANAGVWPTQFAVSAQGFEIAFATNVLGHYTLIRRLLDRSLLAQSGRIVMLTGDIYVLARECTPDFEYQGARGGQQAYCRSKLGNLWLARELARRLPQLLTVSVHPGVVASGLAGQMQGPLDAVRRALLLSTEAGAQTSLVCATQPGIESGGYYHNTMGRVILHRDDPAADSRRAAAFWDLLEGLAGSYLG